MRVRSLLIATFALVVVAIGARVVVLENRSAQDRRLDALQLDIERIARDAASLLVLSQEYLLHEIPRTARQWHAVHGEMSGILTRLTHDAAELQEDVAMLDDVARGLPELFVAIEAVSTEIDRARARERLELLAGHLVAETRRISDGAFTLAERAVEVRHARSRADRRVTFVSMGVFAFFAIAISMLVFRRVLRPMAGLEATARAFRDGNLAARSNYRARDEFGDLSSTFDAMARALQERTARLDTAQVELKNTLNAIPSVIGYWDRTLHNRFANRAYLAWFGIGQEHMSGMHMRDVLRASYDETEPFIEAVLRGEPQIFERTLPRPDGEGERNSLTYFVPDVVDGEVRGFYCCIHDITAIKVAESRLQQAHDRFDIAADSACIGIWEFDPVANSLVWDDRMYRLYGRERESDVEPYALWASSVHPDDLEAAAARLDMALRGEREFDLEFRIVWPNGETRHLKASARVIRDAAGTALRMTGLNTDITERKRAELELRRTTALLQNVLDSASEVSIIAVAPDSTITIFNRGAERLLGYRQEEVIGLGPPLLTLHDQDELRVAAAELGERLGVYVPSGMAVIDPAALGEPREWTYLRKDGSRVRVSLVVTAMRDESGAVLGYLGIAHDVTRQHEYEESLRVAMHKATQASLAKSQFLANMSHEIRTPMNAVIGLSYLLGRTELDETQGDYLKKIGLASTSLLALINSILDLSKVEAGEIILERAPFNLRQLLGDLADLGRVQADAKGITFALDTSADLPVSLDGDAMRLSQILSNLVSNAIKFTERGGVVLMVRGVSISEGRATLRFSVKDTGIGIAAEAQVRLFEPFVQADTSMTRRFGGSGLGLSIVKRFVDLMGGRIDLRSTPGTGSEFEVVLEFMMASQEPRSDLALASSVEAGLPRLAGVRVLVVDDSEVNQEVARRILELEGARVTLAGDGERACAELHAAPRAFDVVLMDVQMPVLDGFSATKRIRDELGLADLPVIALTAGALVSERQRAVAVGMNEFITKPFSPADLVHVIRRHVPPQDGAREGSALHADDPAPPRTTSRWPALPGIDIEDASLRLGGDWALFRSMLKRLLDEFSDIGIVAETTDPADRVAHAARLHKLRGCAGSLGAKEIHRVAGQAEAAYLAQDAAQAERLARQIGTQLGRLGKDAASLFEGPAPDDDVAASGEDDPQALIAFTRLLRQHSLAALDELPRVGPLLRRALGRASFGVLRDLVENLCFEEAAEMVEQRLTQAA